MNIAIPFGMEKNRMVALSDGEKTFKDMALYTQYRRLTDIHLAIA